VIAPLVNVIRKLLIFLPRKTSVGDTSVPFADDGSTQA
jgi:hypothetical protein